MFELNYVCSRLDQLSDCQPNFDHPDTFYNWVAKMDLYCPEKDNHKWFISLFGSSLMLGLMLGSIFLTNLSDLYGRKTILIWVTLASGVLLIPLIALQSYYKTTLALTLLFGMTAACRYSVSYMYSCELSTRINSNYFGLLCLIGDSLSSVVLGFYFIFFKHID